MIIKAILAAYNFRLTQMSLLSVARRNIFKKKQTGIKLTNCKFRFPNPIIQINKLQCPYRKFDCRNYRNSIILSLIFEG